MLKTDTTVAPVPSFFSSDRPAELNPLLLLPGGALAFSLIPAFSNYTGVSTTPNVELTAPFDPLEAGDFIRP